jgi:hypothetical protein
MGNGVEQSEEPVENVELVHENVHDIQNLNQQTNPSQKQGTVDEKRNQPLQRLVSLERRKKQFFHLHKAFITYCMILAKTNMFLQEIVTIGFCCLFLDIAIPGPFSISPEKYKSFDLKDRGHS